ncbi:MAG: PepSY domain-containing protein [Oscillospiraceae bacterium]|nr:PepSY domain-containing protein [Oscillospiraceae bacterium]
MEEAYIRTARTYYPVAVLYLGSVEEARAAVIEAVAAALRKEPENWNHAVLPQLIRICRLRAPERIERHDLPNEDALSPLLPILRLPAGSRRALGFLAAEISPDEAADACGQTADEYTKKLEKALRQLTFTQNGTPAEPDALTAAAKEIPWREEDTAALLSGLRDAAQNAVPAAEPAAGITLSQNRYQKAVSVPLWGIVLTFIGMVVLLAALLLQIAVRRRTVEPDLPSVVSSDEVKQLFSQEYLYIGTAQQLAVNGTAPDAQNVYFLYAKLKKDVSPAVYEIRFSDGNTAEYSVIMDAENGEIREHSVHPAEPLTDPQEWLLPEQLRSAALNRLHLKNVLFLKEKFSTDALYKLEVLKPDGDLCEIQLDAKTAQLLKYSLEPLTNAESAKTISAAEAKKAALAAAGNLNERDVIFTKLKPDGALYLAEFTHDNGTQYSAELDAATGKCTNLEVQPVPAGLPDSVGMLAARDAAVEMAEPEPDAVLRFTKAKLDRRDGAYVYELEFETEQAEYEAVIATENGKLLKYRFSRK